MDAGGVAVVGAVAAVAGALAGAAGAIGAAFVSAKGQRVANATQLRRESRRACYVALIELASAVTGEIEKYSQRSLGHFDIENGATLDLETVRAYRVELGDLLNQATFAKVKAAIMVEGPAVVVDACETYTTAVWKYRGRLYHLLIRLEVDGRSDSLWGQYQSLQQVQMSHVMASQKQFAEAARLGIYE
ncbi:hypothetical protein [Streptomyces antimycoticus]|nr:hypothetical protein [Streptomyces antimycoticus]